MSTSAVPAIPRSINLPSLQGLIDQAVPGSLLELMPGDYGPARLTHPIVIDGHHATVWDDGSVPALELASSGLCVQNLRVRGRLECQTGLEPVPRLSSVRVHGYVQGLSQTDSLWELPTHLDLGTLTAPSASLGFEVSVGESCQIISRISGVSIVPHVLSPGIHAIKVEARDVMADSLLSGELELLAGGIIRVITLNGRVQPTGSKILETTAPIYTVSPAMRIRWQQKNQPVPTANYSSYNAATLPARSSQALTTSMPPQSVPAVAPVQPNSIQSHSQWSDTTPTAPLSIRASTGAGLSSLFDAPSENSESSDASKAEIPLTKPVSVPALDYCSTPKSAAKPKRMPAVSRPALSKMFDEAEEPS